MLQSQQEETEMKVKELIDKLSKIDPDMLIMCSYDGGCGTAPIHSAEYCAEENYNPEAFWIHVDS